MLHISGTFGYSSATGSTDDPRARTITQSDVRRASERHSRHGRKPATNPPRGRTWECYRRAGTKAGSGNSSSLVLQGKPR
ncbi:hypothetical protein [Kitasatospora herbaricolor]|uniref:Uncharacterized protein n=1 Tax=Kitasatospora herbaricolor TaxID=68217 RepID=A0ABZ1WKL9_9ACTN|nr:hypothetical protein [Kitasatospora herbaricolor]